MDGRRRKGRTTRERLIGAATALFGELGYEATSTEAVLARARISRGALYHHFADKQALFDAVLWQVNADIVRDTIVAARGAAEGVAALRAGCTAWLRMARDPGIRRIVLIDAPAVVGWTRWREVDAEHSLGVVTAGIASAARRGLLPADKVTLVAHMLLAAVNELALLIATAADPDSAEREALAAFDLLLVRLLGLQES